MCNDNPKAEVGDIIEIFCTVCRLNLDGSIAAIKDDKVVQVVCRTCSNTQKYQVPQDEEERRRRVIKRVISSREKKNARQAAPVPEPVGPKADTPTSRWRESTRGVKSWEASMYSSKKSYDKGDYIIHPQHGLGVVEQCLHENAVLVLFRDVEIPLEMNNAGNNS